MSLYTLEKISQNNISPSKMKYTQKFKENKSLNLEKIVKKFVFSIFQSAILNYQKEKRIECNSAFSLTDNEKNKIIVSNFVNSLFKEAKNELMEPKIKSRNIAYKQCHKETKSLFLSSKKKIKDSIGRNNTISCIKCENTSSFKRKRTFNAYSNNTCDTNVSTFDKENRIIKSFNTNNTKKKKNEKKINIQIDDVVSVLNTQFNPDKGKYQINNDLNEKIKLTNKRKEATSNKKAYLKKKENNQIKKENDALQKVFTYKNNQKNLQKIIKKSEEENKNKIKVQCNEKTDVGKNKTYTHIILAKNESKNKKIINKKMNGHNEINSIKKIKILRIYNKKVVLHRKNISSIKNGHIINIKMCENNNEKINI